MTTKTRRFEARVDAETYELVSQAASLERRSMTAFIVLTVRDEAERVVARADVTPMPPAEFDAMMAALDREPEIVPALRAAARRPRRIVDDVI